MNSKIERKKFTSEQNFQHKGLGWIPDYPDGRDYSLDSDKIKQGNSERLKRDEVSSSIESLAESLLGAVKLLQENFKNDETNFNILNALGDEIESKIFGGIDFKSTKIHKILKLGEKGTEVVHLKYYLHLIASCGNFNAINPEGEFNHYPCQKNHSLNYFEWLRDIEFDACLEKIVEVFQEKVGITKDGVVGLETYSALSECLTAPNLSLPQKATTEIELVVVPSLIPKSVFPVIFKNLKSWWKKYNIKILSSRLDIDKYFDNLLNYQQIIQEVEDVLVREEEEDSNDQLNNFIQVFETEFIIAEPLVSIVLQSLSPLAASSYDTIEDSVDKAFVKLNVQLDSNNNPTLKFEENFINFKYHICSAFEKIKDSIVEEKQRLNLKYQYTTTPFSKKIDDLKSKEETLNEQIKPHHLQLQSISNLQNLKNELNITKKEIKIIQKAFSSFVFYNFLQIIAIGLLNELGTEEDNQVKNSRFDKKYLIEIIQMPTPNATNRGALVTHNEDINSKFFSISEMSFPVSRRISTRWHNLEDDSSTTKPYFFLPHVVDLSFWCSPIQDQGSLNACSAFAGVALLEYFARRNAENYTPLSPLFLYKAARNLMQCMGDTGASVRETMRAMVVFGVPPEKYWSYEEERHDVEPPSFCYGYAKEYQTLKYFRLDLAELTGELLLFKVKAVLAAGFPCIFGFTVYSSIYNLKNVKQGSIPYPRKTDNVVGGHTLVAVGYDDDKVVGYDAEDIQRPDEFILPKGALLVRNSWGKEWGKQGYGWLPYEYVINGLTADWWSLLKAEWFDAGNFGLGAYDPGNDCDCSQIGCNC